MTRVREPYHHQELCEGINPGRYERTLFPNEGMLDAEIIQQSIHLLQKPGVGHVKVYPWVWSLVCRSKIEIDRPICVENTSNTAYEKGAILQNEVRNDRGSLGLSAGDTYFFQPCDKGSAVDPETEPSIPHEQLGLPIQLMVHDRYQDAFEIL